MNGINGSSSTVHMYVVRDDEPAPIAPHSFRTFRGRARWFLSRYLEYDVLPFWWVAKEWLRNELRYLLLRP